jgi:hypothetical protein
MITLHSSDYRTHFERGVVLLSFDTEQIWGYLDLFDEARFRRQYPDAIGAHTRMLGALERAGISATWFMVGGLALRSSEGSRDRRFSALPGEWTARIPAGDEETEPLWYRRSLIRSLRTAQPRQEIGLHGGLSHFIWTHPLGTREVLRSELVEGLKALEQAGVSPVSFSFAREQETCLDLLPEHGIRCYRGPTVARAYRMGTGISGKLARVFDEVRRATPAPVWPDEVIPGLWTIPASLFLYPIHPSRTRVTGLRSRIERFHRGVDAAIRHRGIFHYCLHPENLCESPHGFEIFEHMLHQLIVSRDRGDIEVLTMADVVSRLELAREREAAGAGANQSACSVTQQEPL